MFKYILICLCVSGSISLTAFGDSFEVLDGTQLCSWYQDSKSCYGRTVELISSYSDVGRIGLNNKSCNLSDGSQFVFSNSMDSLLDTSWNARPDYNFMLRDPSGSLKYEIKKTNASDQSFTIHGINPAGRGLRATFNEFRSEDTDIVYSARCDLYDSKGITEYIVTWDAFWQAQKICPQIMGPNPHPALRLSVNYQQVLSKIQVQPYVEFFNKKFLFFTCRNY